MDVDNGKKWCVDAHHNSLRKFVQILIDIIIYYRYVKLNEEYFLNKFNLFYSTTQSFTSI